MNENNKLYDAVLDLGLEMKAMRKEISEMNVRMSKMEARMDKFEREQHKINALLAENTRAIIKLANRQDEHSERIASLEEIVRSLQTALNKFTASNEARMNGHERRILRLEEKTGNTYFAGEPPLRYNLPICRRTDPSSGGKDRSAFGGKKKKKMKK